DLAVAALTCGALVEEQLHLGGALLRPGRGAVLGVDLEGEPVGVAGGDAGHLYGARGAAGELDGEGGVVVVLDGVVLVADLGVAVSGDDADGLGPFGDDGAETAAVDGGDRPAEELGEVGEVAADV